MYPRKDIPSSGKKALRIYLNMMIVMEYFPMHHNPCVEQNIHDLSES